ncbi:AAA family ATPase [Streptacidiphilus albus]|uniref:AAA family ATPase n=1 Tax=Streptacidiphilus albus TaxID=105425 RepID=UPI00054BE1FD|nr:ATP-binding protein [Streptacidiphilus albus]
MNQPTLVVVSGPSGSGKTTLAHELARSLGCPAICRDEIKEGMAHATPGYRSSPGDALALRTLAAFFDVLGLLLGAGVTVVAEAAFQDRLWRPGLERLAGTAAIRIVHCTVDADVARARIARRLEENPLRSAHDDRELLRSLAEGAAGAGPLDDFVPVSLEAPKLRVDTSHGYAPAIPDILAFIER